MNFEEWKNAYPDAAAALADVMTHNVSQVSQAMTEQAVQQNTRLLAPSLNCFMGRNNSGAYSKKKPPTPGTRWGWCNDSQKFNEQFKTPDLIGLVQIEIQPHHLGRTFGVFVGAEVKDPEWRFKPGDKRAVAQLNCLSTINKFNGIAGFVTNEHQLVSMIEAFKR